MFFFQRKAKKKNVCENISWKWQKKNVFVGLISSCSLPKSPAPVSCMCSSTFNTPDPPNHRRRRHVGGLNSSREFVIENHPHIPSLLHKVTSAGGLETLATISLPLVCMYHPDRSQVTGTGGLTMPENFICWCTRFGIFPPVSKFKNMYAYLSNLKLFW